MVELVVLIGGPFDGEKRECLGGSVLSLPAQDKNARGPWLYRRAHYDSKFFHFVDQR